MSHVFNRTIHGIHASSNGANCFKGSQCVSSVTCGRSRRYRCHAKGHRDHTWNHKTAKFPTNTCSHIRKYPCAYKLATFRVACQSAGGGGQVQTQDLIVWVQTLNQVRFWGTPEAANCILKETCIGYRALHACGIHLAQWCGQYPSAKCVCEVWPTAMRERMYSKLHMCPWFRPFR